MPAEEDEEHEKTSMSKSTIVQLTGPDKWEDWHMGFMCSLMDNDLDGELDKAQSDPIKNKKIFTRIGSSIANKATKLMKTVSKGDGVAAYKVLENAFANKRSLQVVREMIAVINNSRGDESMDKYVSLREARQDQGYRGRV